MEEEYVLSKIGQLTQDKKLPMGVDYVKLKLAVQEDLKRIMNRLLEQGKINYFKTLNGVTVFLKNSKQ